MVVLPEAPPLHTLPLATKVPAPYRHWKDTPLRAIAMPMAAWAPKPARHHHQRPLCGRRGGLCSKIIERDLLPKYPNVDGVVGLNHLYGCGVAINAPAAVVPIRTIHNISLNPNFGGEVMVIGLGCEKLQPERLLTGTDDVQAIPVESASIVSLQDEKACRLSVHGRGYFAGRRTPFAQTESTAARNLSGFRTGCRHAVRRQRCVFWRNGKPGGWVCV